ncbi:YceI family protein [Crocinitomicaceae bacterium CZZ-1]|uniref:YceI family protein n=1 Tax=Taishania pollutisoli TaxID=2766479 RepID=A0A8J6TU39_9FLAO|nr:YceI family protein [Taishania pollutisoli]MBC9813884.1 YceI family protein [Taishania pollutisoli]NGF74962.1 YceI family protein [Fluviicola sp. SGL-29]
MNYDTIFPLTTIVLLLAGLVSLYRYSSSLQPLLNFLFLLLSTRLLQSGISPEESNAWMTGIIGLVAGLNLAVATLVKTKWIRWAAPVVSILILPFIGKNDLLFGDYALNLADAKVTGVIALGFLIGSIAYLLKLALKRFFPSDEQESIQLTAQIALSGLFIIPATFFASWYGLVFLTLGYFLYNAYSEKKNDLLLISLLTVAATSGITAKYGVEGIDLSVGKITAGLIVGAGAYMLAVLATKTTHKLMGYVFVLLSVVLLSLVTLLNNVHPAYGGTESLLAAFFGVAVINLFNGRHEAANILFPALVAIGLFLPSDPFSETAGETTSVATEQQTTSEEPVAEPKGMDASKLSGNYTIVSETAVISFQLGQKGGITKGAIKEFEGTVDFGTSVNSAKFNVKLPTKKLTTFNTMRDESIMGGAYLNAAKFPVMSFSSSGMEPKEDGYLLKGNFTLLGKTNPEDVFIKYLGEKDGKQQFIGKASIDRTKYGMPSSPQEGNVVDFTFTIELK